jgi:hypothetical protein
MNKLEKTDLEDDKFPTNLDKNRHKNNSVRTQQLSWMLYTNVMKICYEKSIKYQLLKRAIDVK